jgi:hypothetical protein
MLIAVREPCWSVSRQRGRGCGVEALTDCVSRYMCIWDPPLTLPLTTRVDPAGSASARARA